MNGVTATKFDPNGSLTRAMFVTILYRAAGEPAVSAMSEFADISANQHMQRMRQSGHTTQESSSVMLTVLLHLHALQAEQKPQQSL